MPYSPPTHKQLHRATLELGKLFKKTLGHYIPPSYEDLVQKVSHMRETYTVRVREKPEPLLSSMASYVPVVGADLAKLAKHKASPKHLREIDCIYHLLRNLPETEPSSQEHIQVHNILLGGIIYRHQAITAQYNNTYPGWFQTQLGWTVENTAMFRTLIDMLEINENNKLDALSITTYCTAYLNFLRTKGDAAGVGSDYIPGEELDFYVQLQSIITRMDSLSKSEAEQMRYFSVVQAIDNSLCKTTIEICPQFEVFSKMLSTALREKPALSRVEMLGILSANKPKYTGLGILMIEYLVKDEEVLNRQEQSAFVNEMNSRLATYCQYTLLGMYLMVLEKLRNSDPVVTNVLTAAIVVNPGESVDVDKRIKALSALEHYLGSPMEISDGNLSLWGDSRQALLLAVGSQVEAVGSELDNTWVCTFS